MRLFDQMQPNRNECGNCFFCCPVCFSIDFPVAEIMHSSRRSCRGLTISPVVYGLLCWAHQQSEMSMIARHTIGRCGEPGLTIDLQQEAEKNSQWCTSASQQVGKTWRAHLLVREFARIGQFCAAGCSGKRTSSTCTLLTQGFAQVLGSSRKGAAVGPSGTTPDHLKMTLGNQRDTQFFFAMGEQMARAQSGSIAKASRRGAKNCCQRLFVENRGHDD